MMQTDKARQFTALHIKGDPVILYNIWDAGTALQVAKSGAKAVGTSSWSMAAAQGYIDGEQIPLGLMLEITSRIIRAVDVPVTLDFEGGYAEDVEALAKNTARAIESGVIGINFEDQKIGGAGLYDIDAQQARIQALRGAADAVDMPLFINARTDVFLKEADASKHAGLISEAIARAAAYAQAGANGFFVPGLSDAGLIAELCTAVALPVNIMMPAGGLSLAELTTLGVARISYGPTPYFTAMDEMAKAYQNIC